MDAQAQHFQCILIGSTDFRTTIIRDIAPALCSAHEVPRVFLICEWQEVRMPVHGSMLGLEQNAYSVQLDHRVWRVLYGDEIERRGWFVWSLLMTVSGHHNNNILSFLILETYRFFLRVKRAYHVFGQHSLFFTLSVRDDPFELEPLYLKYTLMKSGFFYFITSSTFLNDKNF